MLAVAAYRDASEASCPQKLPADHAALRGRRRWVSVFLFHSRLCECGVYYLPLPLLPSALPQRAG
eukprot:8668341-Pyramimonas_sp.AAC.1